MHVSAVIFDLDHTLLYDNHLELDLLRDFANRYFNHKPSDGDLLSVLLDFRTGKHPLLTALHKAFLAWGAPKQKADELAQLFKEEVLAEAPQRVEAVDGIKDVFRALEKMKLPKAILTNGWQELQQLKAKLIGFTGPVFSSEELKAWKPDPHLFLRCCQKLHFEPATTVYVGDSPESDVVGAKSAGLLTIWANYHHHRYPADFTPPDGSIESLPEILTLLAPLQQ